MNQNIRKKLYEAIEVPQRVKNSTQYKNREFNLCGKTCQPVKNSKNTRFFNFEIEKSEGVTPNVKQSPKFEFVLAGRFALRAQDFNLSRLPTNHVQKDRQILQPRKEKFKEASLFTFQRWTRNFSIFL